MSSIIDKMRVLHERLEASSIPHALGGALALAWCTPQARGTVDIDLNIFVPVSDVERVLASLPEEVAVNDEQRALLARDGQVRVFWATTPVDVFLNTTNYHDEVATRVRWETLAGTRLPFLDCFDLAVFKAFFNRTRDWADLEEMAAAGTLDAPRVAAALIDFLGADDPRIERLMTLDG